MENTYPVIDSEWTLFLDRDGVINKKLEGRYVTSPEELTLLPGAADAIAVFSSLFDRIIIVTKSTRNRKRNNDPSRFVKRSFESS